MKLCIVTPSIVKGDGQGRANYEIVLESIRRGYEVTLLTSRLAVDLQQQDLVSWVPISSPAYPTQLLKEASFSVRSAAWLKKHRHQFDVIQVYGAVTSAPGDINTVQFVHSAWLKSAVHTARMRKDYYGLYHWVYSKLNAYWEKRAFRQAKVVVAVSERVRKELVEIGVKDSKIRVIYNGVDTDEFSPGHTRLTQLGLPEKATVALFVGDIRTNRKNLDTVLRALVQVPDLHLVVVGNVEKSPYPELAKTLGLAPRVHFLGYRQDMPAIMQAVDLFVFPSRYEPFGMVVTEAMASGLPVVTAITTGAAEVITPDSGVVLLDSEDASALAEALSELANDRDRRHQMGAAARVVAAQHDWASKANAYVDLFEEVARS